MNTILSTHSFVQSDSDGTNSLNLIVDGMHCPSCVAVIEDALRNKKEVKEARLNLSTKRLRIVWHGKEILGDKWVEEINKMGYRAVPFDPKTSETIEKREEKFLLLCLAVAGFASGNMMLFSVPLWSSDPIEMGESTRTFFHWIQAIVAIPTIAFSGRPFFYSAWKAIKNWQTNMDVPISVAVILTTIMSLFETVSFGHHSYFDSVVMLLFFLLIGRYLEARAKGKARSAAQDLLQMMSGFATVINKSGKHKIIPVSEIKEKMILSVAAGEKIGADGEVIEGVSELDTSLITGETMPVEIKKGAKVFAGTMNISAPIKVLVTKPYQRSLVSEIVKLMEIAEQNQGHYVALADKISRWYTPAVHFLAAATFLGWLLYGHIEWQVALLYSATVLIITCPCALGLAVPIVQVIASGKLLRKGILLKSGSALERLAGISHAVFDKTGTLTLGLPKLINPEEYDNKSLQLSASMAQHSKHPLSVAITKSYSGKLINLNVKEIQACGLETNYKGNKIRLGKRSWCTKISDKEVANDANMELWLVVGKNEPIRFKFSDKIKNDAKQVIDKFNNAGISTILLSGDRVEITKKIADQVGIKSYAGCLSPKQKTERIVELKQNGHNVLMVGDGLNDAPSLSSATISMSPTSAIDISQNASDIVFQGELLSPVYNAWETSKFSQKLIKQNFALAIIYNIIAIPVAIAGYVTPLIAAIAMSSSSLLVVVNALRLNLMNNK